MITRTASAAHELLSFPARFLSELPVGLRISVQASGIHHEFVYDRGSEFGRGDTADTADTTDAIAFDGDELRALAIGIESERLRPSDFKGFRLRKRQDPSFFLNEAVVLDGAN